ncbi:MAG: DEAD/DEAH box helicase family protein [Deltaproteobacteria bacterium]|nr:DEAD/DEAH box helicase family protein [Deltaproteobacteria bacterium]
MNDAPVTLRFAYGTLTIEGIAAHAELLPPTCLWDPRSACHRAPALAYPDVILALRKAAIDYDDQARAYTKLGRGLRVDRTPRPYQRDALDAWRQAGSRGVVVLPTGAGKSHMAMMALDLRRRSTLVIAPTLDLVRQWYDLLRIHFGPPVGVVGGGEHEVCDLTVTTYDSAYLHMEHFGHRFGLVIFDECHHLPGESFSQAAEACLAPFRLGLTATPDRPDERHTLYDTLIGPICYRQDIVDLSGRYLADYDTVRITLDLTPEERVAYDAARETYRNFVRSQGIAVGRPGGWSEFIMRAAGSAAGQEALAAHQRSRHLAFAASAKLDTVARLLHQHRDDHILLFTQDNATTYAISRRFLLPAITHQTKVSERSEILDGLRHGRYGAVVTSRVLNEGVDVPEANVAIVVSGSASVREHVQRLGRVLRRTHADKLALLYELVTRDTTETFTSDARRNHDAYAPSRRRRGSSPHADS